MLKNFLHKYFKSFKSQEELNAYMSEHPEEKFIYILG